MLYQLSHAPWDFRASPTGREHADARPQSDPVRQSTGTWLRASKPPASCKTASGIIGRMGARVSDRIAAIAESATLAVDAKAKALKAAGRPVIGFGAGEPDFPTPDYIVEAAVAAARQPEVPPLHAGRRAARAARRDRRQDPARHRLRRRRRPRCWSPTAASRRSTTRSRRCSTRATRCCSSRRTGRPTRRRSSSPAVCRSRSAPTRRPAISRPSSSSRPPGPPRTKVLLLRLAVQPDRGRVSARAGRGDRRVGGRARPLGRHRRDLRAPRVRRCRDDVDRAQRRTSGSSSSTVSRRPTR